MPRVHTETISPILERSESPRFLVALRKADALTALTVYVALLLLIPSGLVVPGMGNLGSPATLWGLGCLLWWLWHVLSRPEDTLLTASAVRVAVFIFLAAMLLSYVNGMLRAIPSSEIAPSDRNLLRMLSFVGVSLTALDGLNTRSSLLALLRRSIVITTVVAIIGLVEFKLGRPIANTISIPGLVFQGTSGYDTRGDFLRPSSTAAHPLEYGTALACMFPLALMYGIRAGSRIRAYLFPCAVILGVALIVAGSRSSILGLVLSLGICMIAMTARERVGLIIAGIASLAVVYVLVPGMIGTLRYMFLTAGSDSSVLSRTDSMSFFWDLFPFHPLLGRGIGTFVSDYQIFDNQFLGTLIETGIVGTAAFLGLFVTSMLSARPRRGSGPMMTGTSVALIASCVVLLAFSAFFDSWSFAKSFGLMALIPGLCATAGRVGRPPEGHAIAPS